MKIIFLGTGTSTGVPLIGCHCEVCQSTDSKDHRLRSSVYIETDFGNKIVIDTGPDFRTQMLNNHLEDVDAVFFTHNHKDHTAGLDDIRPINHLLGKSIDVYAENYVQKTLRMEYPYIFNGEDYPGLPRIKMHDLSEAAFKFKQDEIIPIRVMHKTLPVLGFRIGDFTYITDANFITDAELQKIKGSKVFVINALRREPHYSHFNLQQALEIIEKVKPEHAYLTHIGHRLGLYAKVLNELPADISLAYDGLQLEV